MDRDERKREDRGQVEKATDVKVGFGMHSESFEDRFVSSATESRSRKAFEESSGGHALSTSSSKLPSLWILSVRKFDKSHFPISDPSLLLSLLILSNFHLSTLRHLDSLAISARTSKRLFRSKVSSSSLEQRFSELRRRTEKSFWKSKMERAERNPL